MMNRVTLDDITPIKSDAMTAPALRKVRSRSIEAQTATRPASSEMVNSSCHGAR